ncbi:transcriptional regulator [Flavobacterium columnare]|uniref:BadM/Rrf2 family transcriptional regulator n=2 Tax=Flavobacterium columnare TaxID=996 RepID=G8XB00_FLACA|nr:Rrf2 family transcriptional regulator [Flavobacterium columnare]AEW85272.1 BadM/Rrf2 family transcriptional regulator [Flavobacterium columnare ATCC 49512]AMO19631.1 Rrf2 family transcriptional regulator [Flavobacterium columnare]ANO48979.1 BadM/Rrf2 family transcriptional regulator [Flavobacterium columnare]APT23014.1 transcriptional regulator [Flavobacterium columnare]AUX17565.1 Rrf2 family transcriptional regulator [Flavobacterium columnare]
MFSKTCEYGIRATIFIASESVINRKMSQKEIADQIDSPMAFTAKILQKLVHKDIVSSSKGSGGGFYIEKSKLKNITLLEIIEALDCDSIVKGCGLGLKDCSEEHPCPFHDKFKDIKSNLLTIFKSTTLEELASGIKIGNTFLKY